MLLTIHIMLRKQQAIVLTLCIVLTVYLVYNSRSPHISADSILPANSTLGFGTILAVSSAQSPRRASLLWAANLTGLDLIMPPQPPWTEDDISAFKANEGSKISRGSALAWMGHLNALQWYHIFPRSPSYEREAWTYNDAGVQVPG